jgi:hypothetical protein
MSYIATFAVALTFNFILVVQFWLYWDNCETHKESNQHEEACSEPVQHVVLFKWKRGTSMGLVERAMKEAEKLKESIRFVSAIKSGQTFTDRG